MLTAYCILGEGGWLGNQTTGGGTSRKLIAPADYLSTILYLLHRADEHERGVAILRLLNRGCFERASARVMTLTMGHGAGNDFFN